MTDIADSSGASQDLGEQIAQSIPVVTPGLHDIVPRTAYADTSAEILRLNAAVRRAADNRLTYADQPADFLQALMAYADSSQTLGAAQGGRNDG